VFDVVLVTWTRGLRGRSYQESTSYVPLVLASKGDSKIVSKHGATPKLIYPGRNSRDHPRKSSAT